MRGQRRRRPVNFRVDPPAQRRAVLLRGHRTFQLTLKIDALFQFLQIRFKFLNCLVPLIDVLTKRLQDNPFEFRGSIRSKASERRWIVLGNRNDDIGLGFSRKRRAAGHHFVKHDAEAPNVSARVNRLSASLLRRHVLRSSQNHSRVSLHQCARHGFRVRFIGRSSVH